jgi:hypothetical protein
MYEPWQKPTGACSHISAPAKTPTSCSPAHRVSWRALGGFLGSKDTMYIAWRRPDAIRMVPVKDSGARSTDAMWSVRWCHTLGHESWEFNIELISTPADSWWFCTSTCRISVAYPEPCAPCGGSVPKRTPSTSTRAPAERLGRTPYTGTRPPGKSPHAEAVKRCQLTWPRRRTCSRMWYKTFIWLGCGWVIVARVISWTEETWRHIEPGS